MGKIIIFLLPFLIPIYSHANGTQTCAPTSCKPPPCGGCCLYNIITNEEGAVVVKELPFKIELKVVDGGNKSNVCEFDEKVLDKLIFKYQGKEYRNLPTEVKVNYKRIVIRNARRCSPSCAPPPSSR